MKISIVAFLFLFFLNTCGEQQKPQPPANLKPDATAVSDTSGKIKGKAEDIQATAKDGSQKAPALPHWATIDKDAESIKTLTERLNEAAASLGEKDKAIAEAIAEAAKQHAQKDKEIGKLKAERDAGTRWLWILGSGLSAAAIVGGIVLLALGNKSLGVIVLLGGFVGVFVSQTLLLYAWLVGLIGIAVLAFVAVVLGVQVYRNRKAFSEAVLTAEVIKGGWTPAAKEKANAIQSPATKKAVKAIRGE